MGIFDLEHLEDVNEGDLVVGGDAPSFQVVTGANATTTGAAAGGRIENSTESFFRLIGGLGEGSGPFSIFASGTAISRSFPF